MSAKDSMAKDYFADNARFADLCNNILYGGRAVSYTHLDVYKRQAGKP